MKKLIVCLLVLVFVMSTQAQFKFEVTKEMKKGSGEITIKGKTFDEVWKAVIRTLMLRKFRIEVLEKEDGMIQAVKKPGIFYEKGDALTTWQIMITEVEEEIFIICSVTLGSDALSAKKPFKKFCEKLKDVLEE